MIRKMSAVGNVEKSQQIHLMALYTRGENFPVNRTLSSNKVLPISDNSRYTRDRFRFVNWWIDSFYQSKLKFLKRF